MMSFAPSLCCFVNINNNNIGGISISETGVNFIRDINADYIFCLLYVLCIFCTNVWSRICRLRERC